MYPDNFVNQLKDLLQGPFREIQFWELSWAQMCNKDKNYNIQIIFQPTYWEKRLPLVKEDFQHRATSYNLEELNLLTIKKVKFQQRVFNILAEGLDIPRENDIFMAAKTINQNIDKLVALSQNLARFDIASALLLRTEYQSYLQERSSRRERLENLINKSYGFWYSLKNSPKKHHLNLQEVIALDFAHWQSFLKNNFEFCLPTACENNQKLCGLLQELMSKV